MENDKSPESNESRSRRDYEAPGISWEEALEVQIGQIACNKQAGFSDACNAASKS